MNDEAEAAQLAAVCAKELVLAAKRDEEIRMMILEVCRSRGQPSLSALAAADPQCVIDFADAVGFLDEQTPDWAR